MGVEKKSGIYIPGAKIPDGDYVRVLMLHKDGTCIDGIGNVFKAVPVPPHGRLIDADALIAAHEQVCSRSMKFNLDLAHTIIPAEEGEI